MNTAPQHLPTFAPSVSPLVDTDADGTADRMTGRPPTLVYGRVVRSDREGDTEHVVVVVDDTLRVVRAQRAASCLLVPCTNDRVLLSEADSSFVLSVLERTGEEDAQLTIDGDAELSARGGRLRLQGKQRCGAGDQQRHPVDQRGIEHSQQDDRYR